MLTAQDAATLYQTGHNFLKQADYDNAILVLKKACSLAPNTLQYEKDLAQAYYYKGDYENAITTIDKLTDYDDADEFVYVLAGDICKANANAKSAEKYYKKGLKKFEKSGALYNAYGNLLWIQKDYSAIKQWEKGIAADPNFAGNYYNATVYYYLTKDAQDKTWSLYYGEIFVNLESYSTKSIEVKNIVLESYKKIFTDETYFTKNTKNTFENAFKETLVKYKDVVNTGVNTENLILLRSLIILDWYSATNKQTTSLYSKHQQLLKEGLFEAYNYWLFESIDNTNNYEIWVNTHKPSYEQFVKYNQNRVFKLTNVEYFK